ncbi:hypothetical protein EXU57_06095 [Segetibacter sp. 3557_3]|uniref:hypothetical protein n=1 Tax=Segetibacter sp. 3557_3 TaxID=2547429 RepID=UPI001058F5DC|nr:hypothetical protein [Segetibacter sp. 3557_3]TDH28032.1 hypothetical protein EXU57_06095 [Segetibacter sp. 3557_3]
MRIKLAAFLVTISFAAGAQTSRPIEFSLAAGVKRNIFENVKKDIMAFNTTPNYDQSLITPLVKNSYSFFTSLKSSKQVNNRFAITNTAGLDMQQLNIESGFKRVAAVPGVVGYSKEYSSTLIPRLKIDFGVRYDLVQGRNTTLQVGLAGGQMIRLSEAGSSYSFVEANFSVQSKNIVWFASGSLSPYNVTLPGFQNYFGNLGADVIGAYEYRIYDIDLGIAIKL